MAFLTETDYDVQIRTEIKAIINQSGSSQALAEQMAEAEMIGYLRPRGYNTAGIFSATAEDRNPIIMMYLIDIVLYHLHSNIVTRAMPKTRADRYEAAISWLDKVSRGQLDPALPLLETEDSTPTLKTGSNTKYRSRW